MDEYKDHEEKAQSVCYGNDGDCGRVVRDRSYNANVGKDVECVEEEEEETIVDEAPENGAEFCTEKEVIKRGFSGQQEAI